MAKIKSYTDLSQSKKLAEILPLESADMCYRTWIPLDDIPVCISYTEGVEMLKSSFDLSANKKIKSLVPSWSLSALLSVIPYNVSFNNAVYRFKLVKFSTHWECYHENFGSVSAGIFKADNPVDACVEMILKLHELKKL